MWMKIRRLQSGCSSPQRARSLHQATMWNQSSNECSTMCLSKQSYKANMLASITESGSEMFEVGHWAPLQDPSALPANGSYSDRRIMLVYSDL